MMKRRHGPAFTGRGNQSMETGVSLHGPSGHNQE
jgi:hypothetical protein